MAKAKEPKLDNEFMFLLPLQTPEERAALRQSIIDEGVREPLIVWKEKGLLVDGHNRWDIVKGELKNVKLKYVVKSFKDRDEVISWIVSNQLGRRNLTDEQRDYFIGKKYLAKKVLAGENLRNGNYDQIGDTTAAKIAEEHNVSEKTVRRNAQFAAGVDASPDKAAILAGTSDKTKHEVIEEGSQFCDKCSRLGPVKDCPQCAKRQVKKTTKKTTVKGPKSGGVLFDWKEHSNILGKVIRANDAIKAGYPGEVKAAAHFAFDPEFVRFIKTEDGNDHEKYHRLLEQLAKLDKARQKRLTKSG